jgi:hypothetical protein
MFKFVLNSAPMGGGAARHGTTTPKGDPVQAYCMKCKTQREMQNPTQVTMKNGRPATQGTCPTCGTKMFKIGAGK